MDAEAVKSVATVPNLAEIHGTLLRVLPEQENAGAIWEIAVDETIDVEGLPNFARAYQGKTMAAYVHAAFRANVQDQQRVSVRVAYRGGATEGRFVIVSCSESSGPEPLLSPR